MKFDCICCSSEIKTGMFEKADKYLIKKDQLITPLVKLLYVDIILKGKGVECEYEPIEAHEKSFVNATDSMIGKYICGKCREALFAINEYAYTDRLKQKIADENIDQKQKTLAIGFLEGHCKENDEKVEYVKKVIENCQDKKIQSLVLQTVDQLEQYRNNISQNNIMYNVEGLIINDEVPHNDVGQSNNEAQTKKVENTMSPNSKCFICNTTCQKGTFGNGKSTTFLKARIISNSSYKDGSITDDVARCLSRSYTSGLICNSCESALKHMMDWEAGIELQIDANRNYAEYLYTDKNRESRSELGKELDLVRNRFEMEYINKARKQFDLNNILQFSELASSPFTRCGNYIIGFRNNKLWISALTLERIFEQLRLTSPSCDDEKRKAIVETINTQNFIDKIKIEIPVDNILYYEEKGQLNYVSEGGGGINLEAALIGGALFGEAGAVVGALATPGAGSVSKDDRYIVLKYQDANGKITERTFAYNVIEAFRRFIPEKDFATVQVTESAKGKIEQKPEVKEVEKSSFDMIREYKSLLDEGIISEEEFSQKKKELLKI